MTTFERRATVVTFRVTDPPAAVKVNYVDKPLWIDELKITYYTGMDGQPAWWVDVHGFKLKADGTPGKVDANGKVGGEGGFYTQAPDWITELVVRNQP